MRSRIYRQHVIEALQELADRALQERRWLSSGPPEVSSFAEAAEQLFTDSGLGDVLERGGTDLGPGADAVLRRLHWKLHRIDDDASPSAIIEDPAMDEVRDLALRSLRAIEHLPRIRISLSDISSAFDDLLARRQTKEAVAGWAFDLLRAGDQRLLDFEPPAREKTIWRGITYLTGVDLQTSPNNYLHSQSNFLMFRKELGL